MIIIEPPPGPGRGRPPLSKRDLEQFLALAKEAVPLRGAVNVLITSDAAVRELNRRFRHKNKATDVLSFPAEDFPRGGKGRRMEPAARVAGDLALSRDTALKQAQVFGHELGVELKILMLHGLLHLAGLNHEADSGEMAAREKKLRGELGLPDGLIERTETDRKARTSSPSRRAPKASIKTAKLPRKSPRKRAGEI